MAIENWIDYLAKLWEIEAHNGKTVRSYRVYEKDEFPEALSVYPCALTYTVSVRYKDGGALAKAIWWGVTEFHLFPDVNKSNYPKLMLYFKRIRNAAAAHVKLNNLVDHFLFREDVPGMQGPLILRYGSEEPHLGILVNWEVKVDEGSEVTIGI